MSYSTYAASSRNLLCCEHRRRVRHGRRAPPAPCPARAGRDTTHAAHWESGARPGPSIPGPARPGHPPQRQGRVPSTQTHSRGAGAACAAASLSACRPRRRACGAACRTCRHAAPLLSAPPRPQPRVGGCAALPVHPPSPADAAEPGASTGRRPRYSGRRIPAGGFRSSRRDSSRVHVCASWAGSVRGPVSGAGALSATPQPRRAQMPARRSPSLRRRLPVRASERRARLRAFSASSTIRTVVGTRGGGPRAAT
jgi:hypothetical protein